MTQVALGRTTPELVLDDLGVVMRPTRFRSLIIMAALGVRWGWAEISRRGAETPRESARPAPRRIKSGASPPGASHRRLADLGGTGSASATRKAGINARSVSETATSAASTDHRQSEVKVRHTA